jgi:lactose/L-arabinose transport system ATP-binding protein
MIYVTHDQVEAMTMADRIVVLRAGRVEQQGRPLDLYHDPANAFVAGFIGSPRMNFLPGRVVAPGRIGVAGAEFAARISSDLAVGTAVQVGLRPEHLGAQGGVEIATTLRLVEALGATAYLYVDLEDGGRVVAECRGPVPEIGAPCHLRFDPAAALLFTVEGARIR